MPIRPEGILQCQRHPFGEESLGPFPKGSLRGGKGFSEGVLPQRDALPKESFGLAWAFGKASSQGVHSQRDALRYEPLGMDSLGGSIRKG